MQNEMLWKAIGSGDPSKVTKLLEKGADPNYFKVSYYPIEKDIKQNYKIPNFFDTIN